MDKKGGGSSDVGMVSAIVSGISVLCTVITAVLAPQVEKDRIDRAVKEAMKNQ